MSSAVATTGDPGTLIPQAKMADIQRLDRVLTESREVIKNASPMMRAFATAAAIQAVEDGITKPLFEDIKNLMNSPLGFKTDRRPGQRDKKGNPIEPYHDVTVKRCVIVALLAGAELAGNQFNIIAGQCYFTKEYMDKVIKTWEGLNNFQLEIGPVMKHGNTSAAAEASASWDLGGRHHVVECFKDADTGRDMRIIVNAYDSSGPDQLRGLVESKLLRRVVARLTGLNLTDDEDVIEGTVNAPQSPAVIAAETEVDPESRTVLESPNDDESPIDDEPTFEHADAVQMLVMTTFEEMDAATSVLSVSKIAATRFKEIKSVSAWCSDAKSWALDQIEWKKGVRSDAIKEGR